MWLWILWACAQPPPDLEASGQCVATFDACSCEPLCLTPAQEAADTANCDLGCLGEIDWSCALVDGACEIEP